MTSRPCQSQPVTVTCPDYDTPELSRLRDQRQELLEKIHHQPEDTFWQDTKSISLIKKLNELNDAIYSLRIAVDSARRHAGSIERKVE